MTHIKFTISSHINSQEKTFKPLCQSLIDSGVPPNDIYFFIGGYQEYKKIDNSLGVNLYHANHNSIDITGLISVLDLNIDSDYWFLLHDTCTVGLNFAKSISSMHYDDRTITMTSDGLSMCMGAYPKSILLENREKILSLKNIDYTDNGLQNAKKTAIKTEDYFLHPKTRFFNTKPRVTNGPVDFYGNGVMRIIEYFPDIDLYKIKANWHLKENYELNL
jgi:hypothetical protein